MRAITLVSAALLLWSVLFVADDHVIDFDSHTDFSTFKTFALRGSKINSPRPELNNPLLIRKIGDAIRVKLTSEGMKETADKPEVLVNFSIAGEDYSVGPGGRANVVGRGLRGGTDEPPRGDSGQPIDYSEATLVIDVTKRDPGTLIWHGVYRDQEDNNAKLDQKLPGDVKKLLSEFPPKKKK